VAQDVRLKPDTTDDRGDGADPDLSSVSQGLQPWQLFLLAALVCATAAMFITRAQGISGVVLLTVLIGTAALVGLAALLAVRPLVTEVDDRTRVIGQRTRDALDREKTLALRALKDLEFDRAMGKLSDSDFQEMSSRLRTRAARLIRQLDAGEGYRDRIERDLALRLKNVPEAKEAVGASKTRAAAPVRDCAACGTSNDGDARFCKECGAKL